MEFFEQYPKLGQSPGGFEDSLIDTQEMAILVQIPLCELLVSGNA